MKKIFFTFIALITLNGCLSTTSNYYVLSMASTPSIVYKKNNSVIGVEKITVPGYLYKREIAVAKNTNQITLLNNALWGEDLDAGLTQRLISFLQKKFNQPNVYAYPWGIEKQPTAKVSVQITRFIAHGDKVYLDANWEVINMRTKKHKARLFSTSVSTGSDADSIVSAMNTAFGQLEESVALALRRQ